MRLGAAALCANRIAKSSVANPRSLWSRVSYRMKMLGVVHEMKVLLEFYDDLETKNGPKRSECSGYVTMERLI